MIPNWSYIRQNNHLQFEACDWQMSLIMQNWFHDFELWIKIMTVTIIQNTFKMPRNKMVQINLLKKTKAIIKFY